MTISMTQKELDALRKERKRKVSSSRRKRTSLLSDKAKNKMFKKFDQDHAPEEQSQGDVNIDEHLKMNDSYMRTGLYVPKKK